MASVSDLNLDAVPEQILPEPGEHDLNLVSIKVKYSKKGKPMIQSVHEVEDAEDPANTAPVMNWILLPTPDMDEKEENNRKRDLINFAESHSIDLQEFSKAVISAASQLGDSDSPDGEGDDEVKIEEFVNSRGRAILKRVRIEGEDRINVTRWV
jgi:hypothetical protein